ncbi:hypothetical protein HYZ80_02530 [Candidatus Parcubacteria bacterium]|nr:hypothetical protein [Candidatus Parcubacteria bacterium]
MPPSPYAKSSISSPRHKTSVFSCFFVKVFDGNRQRFSELVATLDGALTRIDWIRDFPADVQHGAFNIPGEALREFGIEAYRLRRCVRWEELRAVPGFLDWCRGEIVSLLSRWEMARVAFGSDFGDVFPSHRVARLLWRSLVGEFDQSFRRFAVMLEVRNR